MINTEIKYTNNISVEDYNILRKVVGWSEIHPTQAQVGLDNSTYLIAAYTNDKAIGTARIVSDGGYVVYIADVMVLPEFQGKGIGKTMMNMLMQQIINNLHDGYGVYVALMASKGREEFYKKFGFIERPDNNFGAGMTQWISR